MSDLDLFQSYRLLLMFAVGTYCAIATVWRLVSTVRALSATHHSELIWKYLVVQLLRIRLREARRELLWIALLLVALAAVAWLHGVVLPGTTA